MKPLNSNRNSQKIQTGFILLDQLADGFLNSELIHIASYRNMGQHPFLAAMAYKSSKEFNHRIGYISLGHSTEKLLEYLIQSELGIPYNEIDFSMLTERQASILKQIEESILFFKERPIIQIAELLDLCNSMKHENDIDLIIISNSANIRWFDGSSNHISEIARLLKTHAVSLNIPIILASYLPQPLDPKESFPTIEMLDSNGKRSDFADKILLLNRPEYFGIECDESGNSYKNGFQIIMPKSNTEKIGEIMMTYDPSITRIEEL